MKVQAGKEYFADYAADEWVDGVGGYRVTALTTPDQDGLVKIQRTIVTYLPASYLRSIDPTQPNIAFKEKPAS